VVVPGMWAARGLWREPRSPADRAEPVWVHLIWCGHLVGEPSAMSVIGAQPSRA
jgi:hypothetical protein